MNDTRTPEAMDTKLDIPDIDLVSAVANSVTDIEVGGGNTDPFKGFGSLTGTAPRYVDISEGEFSIPAPLGNEEVLPKPQPLGPETVQYNKPHIAQETESIISEAELELSINRNAIATLLDDNPELLPRRKMDDKRYDARRADLQATLDAIAQLPEGLKFVPGLTLIVGENGLGKSTLNHAIRLAVILADDYSRSDGSMDFEEFRAAKLVPSNIARRLGGGSSSLPSILSIKIARHITIGQVVNSADDFYLDSTVLNGQRDASAKSHGEYGADVEISEDLSYGHSHGQLNNTVFEHLEARKKDYVRDLERGRNGLGVGIVYLDEPENGLSPKNHLAIKQKMGDSIIEGSIALCASNSEVLYFDPTIPRVDLEHPELGIHIPNDYPEVYDLEDYKAR